MAVFKTQIAKPDGLALLVIRSKKRRKSREWAYLANAGEFNRQYPDMQDIRDPETRNRCTGHTWRFSLIAAIGV